MQTREENFLSDVKITKKGKKKEKPWRINKRYSILLAESYKRLGKAREFWRMFYCACWLKFRKMEDGMKKLHDAIFCQMRLCPICTWRRSQKIFGQVSKIMNHMTEHYDYEYIFLTQTVMNMGGNDLPEAIDEMMAAWNKQTKTKEFKKLNKGYFRALEITRDSDEYITRERYARAKKYYDERKIKVGDRNPNYNTYHPHFHVIIAVNKSYLQMGGTSGYLNHMAWMKLWRRCANLDYDPWVFIEKVKPDDGKKVKGEKTYIGAVAEIAKYAVKGNQFILDPWQMAKDSDIPVQGKNYEELKQLCQQRTDENVAVLDRALKSRRLIAYGGKMREVHRKLKLKDPESGDLILTDNEEGIHPDLGYVLEQYTWNMGFMNYQLVEIAEDNADVAIEYMDYQHIDID
jgi:plasmid rolling circle replication initiator protein Rep